MEFYYINYSHHNCLEQFSKLEQNLSKSVLWAHRPQSRRRHAYRRMQVQRRQLPPSLLAITFVSCRTKFPNAQKQFRNKCFVRKWTSLSATYVRNRRAILHFSSERDLRHFRYKKYFSKLSTTSPGCLSNRCSSTTMSDCSSTSYLIPLAPVKLVHDGKKSDKITMQYMYPNDLRYNNDMESTGDWISETEDCDSVISKGSCGDSEQSGATYSSKIPKSVRFSASNDSSAFTPAVYVRRKSNRPSTRRHYIIDSPNIISIDCAQSEELFEKIINWNTDFPVQTRVFVKSKGVQCNWIKSSTHGILKKIEHRSTGVESLVLKSSIGCNTEAVTMCDKTVAVEKHTVLKRIVYRNSPGFVKVTSASINTVGENKNVTKNNATNDTTDLSQRTKHQGTSTAELIHEQKSVNTDSGGINSCDEKKHILVQVNEETKNKNIVSNSPPSSRNTKNVVGTEKKKIANKNDFYKTDARVGTFDQFRQMWLHTIDGMLREFNIVKNKQHGFDREYDSSKLFREATECYLKQIPRKINLEDVNKKVGRNTLAICRPYLPPTDILKEHFHQRIRSIEMSLPIESMNNTLDTMSLKPSSKKPHDKEYFNKEDVKESHKYMVLKQGKAPPVINSPAELKFEVVKEKPQIENLCQDTVGKDPLKSKIEKQLLNFGHDRNDLQNTKNKNKRTFSKIPRKIANKSTCNYVANDTQKDGCLEKQAEYIGLPYVGECTEQPDADADLCRKN